MTLNELEIYRVSRECSREAWNVYSTLRWEDKKTMGDQWISAIDSIGANIAEGFGRFHYLDRNRFNYNARGSLIEAIHWTELLTERDKLDTMIGHKIHTMLSGLLLGLNAYIQSTKSLSSKQ